LTAGEIDPNHFDSSYFTNVQWNAPDLAKSELAYKLARRAFEDRGGEIINLSVESALDVFERGDWREW
jgi:non-homologous end joining protein Ku